MIRRTWKWMCALSIFFVLTACNKDDDSQSGGGGLSPLGTGVFVVNEGAFGNSNASISFVALPGSNVLPEIFEERNNRSLGDVAQSMTIIGDRAYLVVNNSGKVEVVDASTFESVGVIGGGIVSPRYIVETVPGTAYVSDWSTNGVAIVNLSSQTVTGTIETGSGPEGIYVKGNEAFVANSGGFADDSTVVVVDITTNEVTDTIQMDSYKPVMITEDANGKLWVLCQGKFGDFVDTGTMTVSRLIRFDPDTKVIEETIDLGPVGGHGNRLAVSPDGTDLYYTFGSGFTGNVVYKIASNASTAPATPFIDRQVYGLGVDPSAGTVYGGLGDFTQNTYAYRYDGTSGALIDSLLVGIAPNGFVFN